MRATRTVNKWKSNNLATVGTSSPLVTRMLISVAPPPPPACPALAAPPPPPRVQCFLEVAGAGWNLTFANCSTAAGCGGGGLRWISAVICFWSCFTAAKRSCAVESQWSVRSSTLRHASREPLKSHVNISLFVTDCCRTFVLCGYRSGLVS